jgi:succinyl-CoA synthetase alpha subunit
LEDVLVAILIAKKTRCIIQGITGRQARMNTKLMLDYGTVVVAGVTPGKGGQEVYGVPVYNTIEETLEHHPEVQASSIFVPAPFAKSAAMEALDAGLKLITLHPERVPHHDMLELIEHSHSKRAIIIGPNTPGVVSPGESLLGMLGARAELARECFTPGPVGVMSRSGGQTTTVCYMLSRAGIGQTTAIGIGGDPFVGARFSDLLPLFEKDEETKAVVLFGEIGTNQEEAVAELIQQGNFTKPLIAYVAGKWARAGMRFGHAGAIIKHGKGTVEEKIQALLDAGAIVLEHLDQLPDTVRRVLD